MRDDEGAIQVVEAVLAALLIVAALVFLTLVQRPAAPATQTGTDLSQVAADALGILQGPDPGSGTDRLEAHALAAENGCTPAEEGAVRSDLEGVLPADMRYNVTFRTPTGAATCAVAWTDVAAFAEPRNAQAAVAFVAPAGNMRAVELVVWLGY